MFLLKLHCLFFLYVIVGFPDWQVHLLSYYI